MWSIIKAILISIIIIAVLHYGKIHVMSNFLKVSNKPTFDEKSIMDEIHDNLNRKSKIESDLLEHALSEVDKTT
jgi:hypothetical protein